MKHKLGPFRASLHDFIALLANFYELLGTHLTVPSSKIMLAYSLSKKHFFSACFLRAY